MHFGNSVQIKLSSYWIPSHISTGNPELFKMHQENIYIKIKIKQKNMSTVNPELLKGHQGKYI